MTGVIEALVPLAAGALAWYWANRRQRGLGAWAAGMGVASLVFLIARIGVAVTSGQPIIGGGGPEPRDHIYLVNADGSGKTRLTESPAQYRDPDWSPGGQSIVFSAFGLEGGIYVMAADGTHVRRLTVESWMAYTSPTWSPDGSKIAFGGLDPGATDTLWVMNRDGSGLTQLAEDSGHCNDLSWSPDGSKLAYGVWGDEGSHVAVISSEGAGPLRITAPNGRGGSPTWSLDSARIIFHAWGGRTTLYSVKADGTDLVPLAAKVGSCEPAWSPDGEKIAFLAGDQVHVMNADGTGQTAVTPAQRYEMLGGPIWCPDGQKLAFWAHLKGAPYPDLYVMNADGTGLRSVATIYTHEPAKKKLDVASVWRNRRLTLHPANWGTLVPSELFFTQSWTAPSGFCWSPDSSKLAFVSVASPRQAPAVLQPVVSFLVVPILVLCGPAAVFVALWSWRRQGLTPGTVTGLLTGGIPTFLYALLLTLIIVAKASQ